MLKNTLKASFELIPVTLMLAFALSVVGQTADPSAGEILAKMQQEYEQSIENIRDYTVVTNKRTTYYKKAHDNGRPYFKSRVEKTGFGEVEETSDLSQTDLFSSDFYQTFKEKATYEGRENLEGAEVHVLHVEKMDSEVFMEEEQRQDMGETINDIRVYVDPDQWVVRQMRYAMQSMTEGEQVREMDLTIHFRDYRDHQGMMIPYETVTAVSGLGSSLTDKERAEAEITLKEMEEDLKSAPEAQRDQLKRMIERQKQMLEDDRIEIITKVEEVKINTGVEGFD